MDFEAPSTSMLAPLAVGDRLPWKLGGAVGDRDELAALDEGAADVDRGADDDEDGECEQEPGDEHRAVLVRIRCSARLMVRAPERRLR